MTTYGAAEFKAQCLRIIEEVASRGTEAVVTRRGKTMVRIVPERSDSIPGAFGWLAGSMTAGDELFSTGEAWDADG
jgi:antitoxin (DNA-binding transcriptional repressor) of toxin-antitoxin stability system